MEKQTVGLALGLALGFGAIWAIKTRAPARAPGQEPAPATTEPTLAAPALPPKPNPKFPASLDLFVHANKRTGAAVSDDGDRPPPVEEGGVAAVAKTRSPAEEQAEDDERARTLVPVDPAEGSPDPLPPPVDEGDSSLGLALRICGGGACVLVIAGWLLAGDRLPVARRLFQAAIAAAIVTALLGLAARVRGQGMEAACWLGVAAFAAVVSFSRLGALTPSAPSCP